MEFQDKDKYSMSRARKVVFVAILVSQAIVLSIIERMIPLNLPIPGAKLGLANIITLTSMYLFSFKETLAIVILRTIMTSFIAGSLSSFLYSFSGALLSFFVMYLLACLGKDKVSTVGVSILGGVFHNIGQLLMAAFIIGSFNIFAYLPFLMVTGIGAGLIVGITVKYLLVHLKKIKYNKNN
jgi:heptaprenyl diphosphate synthase